MWTHRVANRRKRLACGDRDVVREPDIVGKRFGIRVGFGIGLGGRVAVRIPGDERVGRGVCLAVRRGIRLTSGIRLSGGLGFARGERRGGGQQHVLEQLRRGRHLLDQHGHREPRLDV